MHHKHFNIIAKLSVLAAIQLIALIVTVTVKASDSCVTNLAKAAQSVDLSEDQTTVKKSEVLKELARLRVAIEKLGTPQSGILATSLAKDYRRKLDQARQMGMSLTELPDYLGRERKLQIMTGEMEAAGKKKQGEIEKNLSPWVLKEEFVRSWPFITYAVSRDGTRLATKISMDSEINIRDIHRAKDIATFRLKPGWVTSIEFSPDGSRLLVVTNNKTIILYDAMTGHQIQQFVGHTQTIAHATFSPDGLLIGTTSADGRAGIWDIASGTPKVFLRVHDDMANTISFSADSSMVITFFC